MPEQAKPHVRRDHTGLPGNPGRRDEKTRAPSANLEAPHAAPWSKEAALEFLATIPDGGRLPIHVANEFRQFFPKSELAKVILNGGSPMQIVKVYNFLAFRKEGEPIRAEHFRFSVERNPHYSR